ncbi:MAG: helix-turn-helix domain-containing protein [Nitrospira sp.]|nr:helix-turn-helix domain-containing protein [Nitrospira sp.]MBX3513158.1 helix-turn-helix domain-containing protein [Xanthobacteraceae bacterium]MBX3521177.1 helix-turn-helix domain-containing protein [Xanthobacteraceae bacterium]MCW5675403.1 helix-turn-helix domain-containing protein [Xanthobacteraceae bacterium]
MKKSSNRILQGARDAVAFASGKANKAEFRVHVPSDVDVAKLRKKLGLSQPEFSQRYGFNPASVKDWEQGRSRPAGPVRAYLKVIEKEPKAVERALSAA